MKKFKWGQVKIRRIEADQLTEKLLLINLYITQVVTLLIGLVILFFQKQNIFHIIAWPTDISFLYWGGGLAGLIFIIDLLLSKVIPEESMDDGGINDMIFKNRPVWHIILIAAVVAICEEVLFRGAVQHSIGIYWTSIVFAVIHIRYLKHWIPTGWVFLSSFALGYIYNVTGVLWAPILCHFVIDLVSGLIIRFRRDK
ncbi:membrane protease YdiL (CAAX protease family) [Paenibacillus shirakamiensis]|uniref:Membrane protease YdiL (CAAX protease family) n=1 Tax=Paenibacillus shirakamiensis TaxID=1265935 RepID=A0ABS4JEK1_9BACL|nr:type II CAAX endopeptidase family protein [Paenibacillus shirakamiensis]MBP1999510.1 membrane protease YdiL (CAAX protease family) [Paenibacillus shirakamiensis]